MANIPGFTGLAVDVDIQDGEWSKHFTDVNALKHGYVTNVGNLANGTSNGKPAFQILATLDDGSQVVVETTWALIYTAVFALRGRWGEPQ